MRQPESTQPCRPRPDTNVVRLGVHFREATLPIFNKVPECRTMNAPVDMAIAECMQSLARILQLQRRAFDADRYPDLCTRRERLERLLQMLTCHEREWIAAVDRDFGHRCAHETRLAEIGVVAGEARHALRNLARWMKPRRVPMPLHLLPAAARILAQPLGVIGVIGPWNYPVQLVLAPAVAALAAGNRVMVKPSERTPATAALLAELVAAYFREDELTVVEGNPAVASMFSALPFDHLCFTGSADVGRRVAAAAAENLTPVTLELGGKSPALLDSDADFALVAPRLALGKLFNAGQTCIAPDYALVPKPRLEEFVRAMEAAVRRLYPAAMRNADYSSIIDTRHYVRLIGLLEDARSRGARVIALANAPSADAELPRRLPPALVLDVSNDMAIMREEIFGPLLPVETYSTLDDAIARINARPHPLALYWFGNRAAHRERVLRETLAGGVTVNDTLWHFAHPGLPFGGVRGSGSGAYHGEHGFARFSHLKPVFVQSRLTATRLLAPPYGRSFERSLALLRAPFG
jgi:coniferyl-aldehyde dehydrogenase